MTGHDAATGIRAMLAALDRYIDTREAAALLGITPAAVRKLAERGKLTPLRPGARPLRFARADVEALAEQRDPDRHNRLDTLYQHVLDTEHPRLSR